MSSFLPERHRFLTPVGEPAFPACRVCRHRRFVCWTGEQPCVPDGKRTAAALTRTPHEPPTPRRATDRHDAPPGEPAASAAATAACCTMGRCDLPAPSSATSAWMMCPTTAAPTSPSSTSAPTTTPKWPPAAPLGLAGHRGNAIWFCHQHTGLARRHEHLSTSDGLAAIDTATGCTPRTHPTTMTADQLPRPASAHARSRGTPPAAGGMFKPVRPNAGTVAIECPL